MQIELRSIDSSNRNEVIRLTVADRQMQYIASNQASLETAAAEEHRTVARPFAIYADGKPVGFTMFAFDLASDDPQDRYWLWRFMIDRALQGNGYGSAALQAIIDYFRANGADHILLSTKEPNTAALALYRKYGFTKSGAWNGNEIVLRLPL